MSESVEMVAASAHEPKDSGRIAVSTDRRHVDEKARWARADAMTNAERAEIVRTNECPYCGCDGFKEWGTVPVGNGLAWDDGELVDDGCGGDTVWDAYEVTEVACRNYCGATWTSVGDLVAGLPRLQPPDPQEVRIVSHFDYRASQVLVQHDPSFYALIMAAMRKADTPNTELLKAAWPDVYAELFARYHAPAGLLPGESMECERCGGYGNVGRYRSALTVDDPCPDCGGRGCIYPREEVHP